MLRIRYSITLRLHGFSAPRERVVTPGSSTSLVCDYVCLLRSIQYMSVSHLASHGVASRHTSGRTPHVSEARLGADRSRHMRPRHVRDATRVNAKPQAVSDIFTGAQHCHRRPGTRKADSANEPASYPSTTPAQWLCTSAPKALGPRTAPVRVSSGRLQGHDRGLRGRTPRPRGMLVSTIALQYASMLRRRARGRYLMTRERSL